MTSLREQISIYAAVYADSRKASDVSGMTAALDNLEALFDRYAAEMASKAVDGVLSVMEWLQEGTIEERKQKLEQFKTLKEKANDQTPYRTHQR